MGVRRDFISSGPPPLRPPVLRVFKGFFCPGRLCPASVALDPRKSWAVRPARETGRTIRQPQSLASQGRATGNGRASSAVCVGGRRGPARRPYFAAAPSFPARALHAFVFQTLDRRRKVCGTGSTGTAVVEVRAPSGRGVVGVRRVRVAFSDWASAPLRRRKLTRGAHRGARLRRRPARGRDPCFSRTPTFRHRRLVSFPRD